MAEEDISGIDLNEDGERPAKRRKKNPGTVKSTDDAARKNNHRAAEKKRRDKINEKIKELREMLDSQPADSKSKSNTSAVLQRTVDYIVATSSRHEQLWQKNRELLQKNANLRQLRQNLRQGMDPQALQKDVNQNFFYSPVKPEETFMTFHPAQQFQFLPGTVPQHAFPMYMSPTLMAGGTRVDPTTSTIVSTQSTIPTLSIQDKNQDLSNL
eukprot:TRINITY_DN937_c0_g1_i3.p1 TRINITY_DN937_c0_g1~~TRINITY_DN937_c0_g1_i3.p1  ORF type:complete len:212 (-),score=51.30 TRINITY_DN937_c0_g1_i3:81-716(-)